MKRLRAWQPRRPISVSLRKAGVGVHPTDAQPYVDAVNGMTAGEGQCQNVIDLHVKSVNAHYEVPKNSPTLSGQKTTLVEHYQTPAILKSL